MVSGAQITRFVVFLAAVAAWASIDHWFGQTEAVRFWGAVLLVTALVFATRSSIPVYLGTRLVSELKGWRKGFVLLPAFLIGALVALYPHEVACAIHLRGYRCT